MPGELANRRVLRHFRAEIVHFNGMSRPRATLACMAFVSLEAAGGASAAEKATHAAAPATVEAVRAMVPIRLDGQLDDEGWARANPAQAFLQRDPHEGRMATERTELRITYDDDALYVGARLFDGEPAGIVRRLSRRDDWGDADSFTLYLDPQHDHVTGARFTVTAAGVQSDAAIFNDSWDDRAWDAVWESAVATDDRGWTAEMRIPFSQLRFPAGAQAVWGINAERYIQRKNESAWLELVRKDESGVASRMAHLVGIEDAHPRRALSVVPYLLSRGEHVPPADRGPFGGATRRSGGIGMDLKYGISTSFTLDATINPDFGQVEVDPAVVNLTQFETFFEEKRPFFLEGAQIFRNFGRNGSNSYWAFNRSEPSLFYSRRIGRAPHGELDGDFVESPASAPILGAAKLTGKTSSGWSVAALAALTARRSARAQTAGVTTRQEVEPLAQSALARVYHDGTRSGFGFLATALRRPNVPAVLDGTLAERAFVVGADGHLFLDRKRDWVVNGSLSASRIEGSAAAIRHIQELPEHNFQRPDSRTRRLDPDARSLSGWTGSVTLNRNAGNAKVNAVLWGTSPGFECNDLGFNFRSDRWGGHVVVALQKTSPDRWTRQRDVSLVKWYALNFDGQRQDDAASLSLNAQLLNYWRVGVSGFMNTRASDDQLTRGGPSVTAPPARGGGPYVESDSRKRVGGRVQAFVSGNDRGNRYFDALGTLWVKPTSRLTVHLGPTFIRNRPAVSYVATAADPTATATYGSRYVVSRLSQTQVSLTTRASLIFSPYTSLDVFAQPLLSTGDYTGFGELARPGSLDLHAYGDRLHEAVGDPMAIDPDGPGPAPVFTFDNPDFNVKSLRVNAVFRWEWRPGSTLYLVWTQTRDDEAGPGRLASGRDVKALFRAPAHNVLLAKITARVGR
jgi:hypothetical protein